MHMDTTKKVIGKEVIYSLISQDNKRTILIGVIE